MTVMHFASLDERNGCEVTTMNTEIERSGRRLKLLSTPYERYLRWEAADTLKVA